MQGEDQQPATCDEAPCNAQPQTSTASSRAGEVSLRKAIRLTCVRANGRKGYLQDGGNQPRRSHLQSTAQLSGNSVQQMDDPSIHLMNQPINHRPRYWRPWGFTQEFPISVDCASPQLSFLSGQSAEIRQVWRRMASDMSPFLSSATQELSRLRNLRLTIDEICQASNAGQ